MKFCPLMAKSKMDYFCENLTYLLLQAHNVSISISLEDLLKTKQKK